MIDIGIQVSNMIAQIRRIEVSPFHTKLDDLNKFTTTYESTTIEMQKVDSDINDLASTLAQTKSITDTKLKQALNAGNFNMSVNYNFVNHISSDILLCLMH